MGGGCDCFFKSVSHQLYGDSTHHLAIRQTAVQYLRQNLERFIESILHKSWSQYICDMFMRGTWADHIVIQAVADSFNSLPEIRVIDHISCGTAFKKGMYGIKNEFSYAEP